MKAYLDSEEVRAKFMGRVWGHYKVDEIIKGVYWERGKGCLVGCMLHSGNHKLAEELIGFPAQIMHLADRIFEYLPNAEAKELVPAFYDAPKTGADLTLVWPKFAVWLLTDGEWGVLQFAKEEAEKKSIVDVAQAYERVVAGQEVMKEWRDLKDTSSAACSASACSASAYAAYYAAYSAACSAAYAAYAASAYAASTYAASTYAASTCAAREFHYRAQSKKLLSLMKAA